MAEAAEVDPRVIRDNCIVFCEVYSECRDVETYEEEGLPEEGLTCDSCAGLNLPNRKCQVCYSVLCYACYKCIKFDDNRCLTCNAFLAEELDESLEIYLKLVGINMKCPRRNCGERGPFLKIRDHFLACVQRRAPLTSPSRYSVYTEKESDASVSVYLREKVSSMDSVGGVGTSYTGSTPSPSITSTSKKRYSSEKSCFGKVFKCLTSQLSLEDIVHGKMNCEDLLNIIEPPSVLIEVPEYPYKAVAKYEDGEVSICIPSYDQPEIMWHPPYYILHCEIVVTPEGEKFEIKCNRRAEVPFGTQIFNDGEQHYRIKFHTFLQRVERSRAEGRKMPCVFLLRWEKPSVPDEVKHGRESIIVKDLAREIVEQETKGGDQFYSDYFFGKPEPLRCRASLDLENPEKHRVILRVFTMKNDHKYEELAMLVDFKVLEMTSHEPDAEVVKEHFFSKKHLVRAFHTGYYLSDHEFWHELCRRSPVIKIEINFYSISYKFKK